MYMHITKVYQKVKERGEDSLCPPFQGPPYDYCVCLRGAKVLGPPYISLPETYLYTYYLSTRSCIHWSTFLLSSFLCDDKYSFVL